jgi:hypothetical protein
MPDPGQKDPNAIRYEDQKVCRSSTELNDEGPQGVLSTECQLGILLGTRRDPPPLPPLQHSTTETDKQQGWFSRAGRGTAHRLSSPLNSVLVLKLGGGGAAALQLQPVNHRFQRRKSVFR